MFLIVLPKSSNCILKCKLKNKLNKRCRIGKVICDQNIKNVNIFFCFIFFIWFNFILVN